MLSSAVLLLLLASVHADICRGKTCSQTGDPRPCTGEHCPGSRSSRPVRHSHYATTAVVRPAACTDEDCVRSPESTNHTRDCKGFECRLPLRIRPRVRARACVGESCVDGAASEDSSPSGAEQLLPVHLADRAAQFLGDFPEFGYPSPEVGGAPLGVQLTCDVKPGENEVPSEDALILHLQLAKGQEKLVEALRAQQVVIRDLQHKLADQQEALLSQQRHILEQQGRMYEQMDAVKAQYGLLLDTVKQVSFRGLQGELQSYFESHLAGLQSQARSHLQNAVHKADAKVMDVVGEAHIPQPLIGCPSACGADHFCDFQRDPPQCEKCTMCPPGFFLISSCSPTADTMCQDRDECLGLPNICGERVKCLNTPGGFRCLGVSAREAEKGFCGHNYFYNQELQECQACSDCDGHAVVVPCMAVADSVCASPSEGRLSQSWSATVVVPSARKSRGHVFPGLQLSVRSKESSDLLSSDGGQVTFLQHGLLWLDLNLAIKHSCRNFLQVGLRFNSSQEEEGQDLSGVRIEQPEGKYIQGASVSAGLEVEPNDTVSVLLRSPNQHCNQSKDLHVYDVTTPTFSLLWLSHDTGAVAMSADMSLLAHYQANYRPTFRITSVSDPYMVGLTHDSRGVRFTESGVVKFVLQQALYSMGHTCIREGFFLIAYASRNGTGQEAAQAFKTGVNYRDTSITLSGTVAVSGGDTLSFEITSPSQCSIRYFGDSTGISMLSLVWIPSAVSSALTATVAKAGQPLGAVRNKPLTFQQVSPDSPQVRLARSGEAKKNFVFLERGTANVALNLRLIHSCNIVKVTLQRSGSSGGPVAQQVSGHMPEGSEWASVGLRASFQVENGTAVYVTLDCIRGRINQISHDGGTNISILWVAA
ncbi:uncharacterized protein nell3 [Dunckerocampus dactyliophorus]|uniref:uncharacterized protein nell3 n=1 Tax=Dunckerocampus dactyliophorus TaxID=161453 RepID=UPI002405F028|nr:uncharacterized protein nell3 [Dunckerocampus dactyliophorus]